MIFKESSERIDDSKEFFLFWSFGILKKVVMKKSFTFSFCERDFLYTQTLKEEEEEKDVGIVRSHPRLVHGRTKAPPVLVSMRVRWQKARLLFLFLRRRLRLLPFWCVVVFKSAFGCLEFFYPRRIRMMMTRMTFLSFSRLGSLSARERQNLTDRLLLSSHACDKTG